MQEDGSKSGASNPLWLLLELTYRCPLHCVYCSNPVNYTRHMNELSTETWTRVMREAREIGAAQLGFSGGEPLMRDDLEVLVKEARSLGFYTNLITSGIGLNEKRIATLHENGLDHIQLSFQDSTRELNDFLTHTKTFELKLNIARMVKQQGYPIVLNVVLHRQNIDHIEQILAMAERLDVDYLELANTQYYGWAFLNREHLLPSREQIARAEEATARFRERVRERIRVFFVVPDYYEERPKPCMNGWGAVFLAIGADGVALPCHQARMLPGFDFPHVDKASIRWIWYESPAFNRFRGFDWMDEPCRSCPERFRDFGGCRCQAFLVTSDAANTDPVCSLSPMHYKIVRAVECAQRVTPQPERPLMFRDDRNSRELSSG